MSNPEISVDRLIDGIGAAVAGIRWVLKGRPLQVTDRIVDVRVDTPPFGAEASEVPANLREQIQALLPGRGRNCDPPVIGSDLARKISEYCRDAGHFPEHPASEPLEFEQQLQIGAAFVRYAAIGELRIHEEVPGDSRDGTVTVNPGFNARTEEALRSDASAGGTIEIGPVEVKGGTKRSRKSTDELTLTSGMTDEVVRRHHDWTGYLNLSVSLHFDVWDLTSGSKSTDCKIGVYLGKVKLQTIE